MELPPLIFHQLPFPWSSGAGLDSSLPLVPFHLLRAQVSRSLVKKKKYKILIARIRNCSHTLPPQFFFTVVPTIIYHFLPFSTSFFPPSPPSSSSSPPTLYRTFANSSLNLPFKLGGSFNSPWPTSVYEPLMGQI